MKLNHGLNGNWTVTAVADVQKQDFHAHITHYIHEYTFPIHGIIPIPIVAPKQPQ